MESLRLKQSLCCEEGFIYRQAFNFLNPGNSEMYVGTEAGFWSVFSLTAGLLCCVPQGLEGLSVYLHVLFRQPGLREVSIFLTAPREPHCYFCLSITEIQKASSRVYAGAPRTGNFFENESHRVRIFEDPWSKIFLFFFTSTDGCLGENTSLHAKQRYHLIDR